MARRLPAEAPAHTDWTDYYERLLSGPATLPWEGSAWAPVAIGPTWRIADDGTWALPAHTSGWQVLAWASEHLTHGAGPWRFTPEQARWVLWWYATTPDGRFVYRDAVLQRLKGWGKDPLGAVLCAVELCGPARPYLAADEWVTDAWVQTAAVSLEQTKNTTRLFPGLFSDAAKTAHRLQIGKELVHAGTERLLQAVTSSPATLEGARATFVLLNETHHWMAANDGHEMAAVIDRNVAKSPDGAARTLRITNAYEPGLDSVAERDREAYEAALAGTHMDTGVLYDSLEAPADAPLDPAAAAEVISAIRGDSVWIDVDRVVASVLDARTPPATSRRYWFNQVVAAADSWLSRQDYDAIVRRDIATPAGAMITLGFDGSKSDDHTALVAALVETDHLFPLGVWTPDPHTGVIDRNVVDAAVRTAFEVYDVVGFYSDLHPFESYVDAWAAEFGSGLCVAPAKAHPIAWDMRGRAKPTVAAVERLHDAIVERVVTVDPDPAMAQHFYAARRYPTRHGISVRKEHRESPRKIDAVLAAVLARQARMDYLALPESRRRSSARSGVVW